MRQSRPIWLVEQSRRNPGFHRGSVVVDELDDVAHISGLPELPRQSKFHA